MRIHIISHIISYVLQRNLARFHSSRVSPSFTIFQLRKGVRAREWIYYTFDALVCEMHPLACQRKRERQTVDKRKHKNGEFHQFFTFLFHFPPNGITSVENN